MKSIQLNMVAILVLAAALSGYAQESRQHVREQSSRTNTWQVQVGWVHQFSRGMSVSGPAPSLSHGYRSLPSGVGLTYPDNSALIPRDFDNGYVRPDMWTGDDAGVPADRQGMTWNWGANAGQYNYDGGNHPTLTYHIDQGEYVDSAHTVKDGKSHDSYDSNGVEVKARRLIYSWTDTRGSTNEVEVATILDLNLMLGLAWFPRNTQRYRRAIGQDMYGLTETYTYLDYHGTGAGGSWPALVLPYSGTATDAGPLIPVTPESSSINLDYQGGFVNSVAIKSKMWHLRGAVGVELVKPITERLDVYVSPQVVFEFVDMKAERAETTTFTDNAGTTTRVASRTNKKHKMTVMPGVLLTAGADYRFTENWYAGASLGWQEMISDPSVRVGANKVKYDLGGGEFSLYVGRSF